MPVPGERGHASENADWMARQLREAAPPGRPALAHCRRRCPLSGYAGNGLRGASTGFELNAASDRATAQASWNCAGERARIVGVPAGAAHRGSAASQAEAAQQPVRDPRPRRHHATGTTNGSLGGKPARPVHSSCGPTRASTWTSAATRAGRGICYAYRFPELYRHYVTLDVRLMFHAFHAGLHRARAGQRGSGPTIGTEYSPLTPDTR